MQSMERTNVNPRPGVRARRMGARALAAALLAVLLGPPAGASAVQSRQPPRRPTPAALHHAPVPVAGGWLGVGVDTRIVDAAGAGLIERVVITQVEPRSPAARAGLRAGDVVLELDGEPAVAAAFRALPFTLGVGDTVELLVRRQDRNHRVVVVAGQRPVRYMLGTAVTVDTLNRLTIELMDSARAAALAAVRLQAMLTDSLMRQHREMTALLADLERERIAIHDSIVRLQFSLLDGGRVRVLRPGHPDSFAMFWLRRPDRADSAQGEFWRRAAVYSAMRAPDVQFIQIMGERGVAGAEFVELNPGLAQYFAGVTDGLLTLRVAPSTPASRARLEPGDVVISVEGRPVHSVGELRAAVLEAAGSTPREVRLEVIRKGERRQLRLRSEQL